MPSGVHHDRQQSLISAASQVCHDLGLRDGVFNVEMYVPDRQTDICLSHIQLSISQAHVGS